ncbi:ATP-dependent RNA helicase RhlE [Halarcobacter mediterraneus]|uniref:DEAD-box ATP-dependent RNA helicase RhpA n=1 Tax=Halarcobacter mediterraneus TaxID=2023153 RepID=A0A4Q1AVS7_9BACT|nr:DEAD/DEAH box helicase [Halarcobacter mediterraneus]RXK11989.1 ATP-dependent RNA helicase RhlE [Halarcobacter mediterraneus]
MSFSHLGLNPNILKAIKEQGYTKPTPIQKQAIPIVLEKNDILAAAQTGTGKTAAFTLPLLEIMNRKKTKNEKKRSIKALILTPTRELASQVAENIDAYCKYLPYKTAVVFGGVGINPQKATLRKGVDIVIATPGRLLDHISQKTIDLSKVDFLVLDEADRMLDMGFIHDIKKIVTYIPKHRQTLLFSATFSNEIKKLSQSFLDNPKLIEVARSNTLTKQVSQVVHYVKKDRKRDLLVSLLSSQNWNQILVFTRTKHGANKLCEFLNSNNINSLAIHGGKSQGARTTALKDFKLKKTRVLVATDIAARGLDIEQLPHVINFELPNVPEDYVHRIGRTGRAGNIGEAISLVCDEEFQFLKDIEKLTKTDIPIKTIEGFTVVKLNRVSKKSTLSNSSRRSKTNSRNHKNNDNSRSARRDRSNQERRKQRV